jgi:UDP-N-acetyl-D-galactosamine dehydrogenase
MSLVKKLKSNEEKIALVGLGYVGMPIAVEFSKKGIDVIGFDLNKEKIETYKKGIDPTNEVGDDEIAASTVEFTSDETKLREAKFHIVAVPTPVNSDHTPDLTPVEKASTIVGRNMVKGSVVVFESTVYPGVTEEICKPILERESGLECGIDFKIAYSAGCDHNGCGRYGCAKCNYKNCFRNGQRHIGYCSWRIRNRCRCRSA